MLDLTKFEFQPGKFQNKEVIFIRFQYDKTLIQQIKKLSATWNPSTKSWYLPDQQHFRSLFNLPPKQSGKNALHQIHAINQPAFLQLQETLQLKGYSPSTLKTYSLEFAQLLYLLKDFPVTAITFDKLRSYILYCIRYLRLSENQLHSRINAIKFYFEQVLKREKFMMDLPRPKKPLQLPKVLNTTEISALIDTCTNLKHKLILKLCYGMGLRVSEVINLRITDIDSKRMQVLIAAAKGKKDRYVNLPHSVLEELRTYYKTYKPLEYLFEGQYGGKYSIRSAQAVFKSAMRKARIKKPVGIHALRHSYATHLLENGTDISFIQNLLGHNNIKTTLIYTHVGKKELARVRSPLDDL